MMGETQSFQEDVLTRFKARTDQPHEFLDARNSALLSLDESKIRAYAKKYGATIPDEPEVFWRAVHKARTGITSLPMNERIKSRDWLREHGSESWDDGDIPDAST